MMKTSKMTGIVEEVSGGWMFSKTTCWLYPVDGLAEYITAGPLPNDLVPVTDAEYEALSYANNHDGKIITADKDGRPIAVNPPPPPPLTDEQLTEFAANKREQLIAEATATIAPLQDAVDLDDATATEIALLKKWKQYRVAVNRVADQPDYPREIDWPIKPV